MSEGDKEQGSLAISACHIWRQFFLFGLVREVFPPALSLHFILLSSPFSCNSLVNAFLPLPVIVVLVSLFDGGGGDDDLH